MATHLIGTGNIGKRILEKGKDINVITKKELNLETKPLNYNFDKDSIGGTPLKEGDGSPPDPPPPEPPAPAVAGTGNVPAPPPPPAKYLPGAGPGVP